MIVKVKRIRRKIKVITSTLVQKTMSTNSTRQNVDMELDLELTPKDTDMLEATAYKERQESLPNAAERFSQTQRENSVIK